MTGDCTLTEHTAAHKSPQLPARAQAMQYSLCAMEKSNVKNVETRRIITNFLQSPPIFSGIYT